MENNDLNILPTEITTHKVYIPEPIEKGFNRLISSEDPIIDNLVLRGGRGGGKSYSICLLLLPFFKKYEIMHLPVYREISASNKDSIRTEFINAIRYYEDIGLFARGDWHIPKIGDLQYRNKGSRIMFYGLSTSTGTDRSMKSFSSHYTKFALIEEAQYITQTALDILMPTIRSDGSKCIFLMNPNRPTDAVVKLVGRDTIHVNVNITDNKMVSEKLVRQMEESKARYSKQQWEHIWLGKFYAEDSPFISVETIENCRKLSTQDMSRLDNTTSRTVIGGVDIGWTKDAVAIVIRRGSRILYSQKIYNSDENIIFQKLAELRQRFNCDIWNIDNGAVAHGLLTILRNNNFPHNAIDFGGASDVAFNKRAEMGMHLERHMRTVGLNFIPIYDNFNGSFDDELIEDISYLKIDTTKEKLKLAGKEEIKKIIGRSPDKGDALFLTFALPYLDNTNDYEQGGCVAIYASDITKLACY